MCHSKFLGLKERGGGACGGRTIATGADLGDEARNASQGEVSQGRDGAEQDGSKPRQREFGCHFHQKMDRGSQGSFLSQCKQTLMWLVCSELELFCGSAEVMTALTTVVLGSSPKVMPT